MRSESKQTRWSFPSKGSSIQPWYFHLCCNSLFCSTVLWGDYGVIFGAWFSWHIWENCLFIAWNVCYSPKAILDSGNITLWKFLQNFIFYNHSAEKINSAWLNKGYGTLQDWELILLPPQEQNYCDPIFHHQFLSSANKVSPGPTCQFLSVWLYFRSFFPRLSLS